MSCSWVDEPGLNIQVVRYEDMVRQPVACFAGIVRFAGLAEDPGGVQKAVEFSRFETAPGAGSHAWVCRETADGDVLFPPGARRLLARPFDRQRKFVN